MPRITLAVAFVAGFAFAQNPEARFFDERVEPILRNRCLACHNEQLKDGSISFLDRESLLKRGKRGAAVVPGKPGESILMEVVRHDGDIRMPPGGKLAPEEIATLAEWIERGAPWGTKLRGSAGPAPRQLPFELWTFGRLDRIGDDTPTILGHPKLIDAGTGRAVEFNGRDDALVLDIHPLAGARAFTWEVVFRPDSGGSPEQCLLQGGTLLLNIRIVDGRWTLVDGKRLHPLGAWYHLAMVYDGRELRQYVNGEMEAAAEVEWGRQEPGRCSIGARIDRRDHFKGAIHLARMTRDALLPEEFLKTPAGSGGTAAQLYDRANALFERHDMEAARRVVEEALHLDPRLVPALTLKAKLAMASKQMDEAQQALETAVAARPRQSYPRFLLGFLFYLKNDFARARDTLALADVNDPRVTFYQALAEEGLNHVDAAVAYYERTLKLDRSTAEPRVSYARLLFEQGKLDRAEELVEEALKLAPRSAEALYEKGRCLVERGQFEQAAELGERALVQPEAVAIERRIRYLLIRAYQKTGNVAMAEKHRAIFEKLPNPLVR